MTAAAPSLRPPQMEGVQAIFRELHYRRTTLRVAATGTGKTHEQAATGRVWLARGGDRVLHTAPRGELLQQAAHKYMEWMPWLKPGLDIGFEKAQRRAHAGQKVILASLSSLHEGRLASVPKPDLIVIDEAHLAIDSLERLLATFPDSKVVGWTATPDRLDAQRLLPWVFESVAHRYELGQAIADGYLVPFQFEQAITRKVNLSKVDLGEDGDFDAEALARVMMTPESLHATVTVTRERMGKRPTLVFACNREHAYALEALYNHYEPGSARAVEGTMKDFQRQEILKEHAAGKFQVLISVILLTYGVDMPWVSHVVMARPTLSRCLYSQMAGRGSRLLGATLEDSVRNGKADCLVTDLVANTERHTLITPEWALEPDHELDAFQAPAQAETEEEEELEAAVEEEILSTRQRQKVGGTAEVSYEVVAVNNQLSVIGVEIGPAPDGAKPATAAQVEGLEKLGLQIAALLTEEQAEQVLNALRERRANGWCTLKMARTLQKFGLNPNVSIEDAKWAIGRLESSGWKMTKGLGLEFAKRRLIYEGTRSLVLSDDKNKRRGGRARARR